MDEPVKMAFEFSSRVAIELITISTAIITLTVTFAKDIFKSKSSGIRGFLFCAWLIYFISIVAGVMTLMTLTGALQPKDKVQDASASPTNAVMGTNTIASAINASGSGLPTLAQTGPSIWNDNTRLAAGAQVVTFILGTLMTVIYGGTMLLGITPPKSEVTHGQATISIRVIVEAKERTADLGGGE